MSLEFKNKTFQKVFRGYSPEEVEEYLDYIDGEYRELERISRQNEKRLVVALKKLDETSRRLEEYIKAEAELAATEQQIMAEAEYTSKRMIAESKLKAAKIIKQATDTAERIMQQNDLDLAEAKKREEIVFRSAKDVYSEVCKFRESILDLYRVHLEAVDALAEDAKEFAKNVDDIRENIREDNYSMFDMDEEPVEQEVEPELEYADAEPEVVEEEAILEYEEFAEVDEMFEEADDIAQDEPVYEEDTESADFDYENEDFAPARSEEVYYAEEDDGWYAAEEDVVATGDLDDFFMDDVPNTDMSLTDEFEIIFSNNSSKKNIDEIRRQPTVVSEEASKHGRHDKKIKK